VVEVTLLGLRQRDGLNSPDTSTSREIEKEGAEGFPLPLKGGLFRGKKGGRSAEMKKARKKGRK